MTKYTDFRGNQIILCDFCRHDIQQGDPAFTLCPGVIKDGYHNRDYEKADLLLCTECTRTVGHMLNLIGTKRADNHNMSLLEAA